MSRVEDEKGKSKRRAGKLNSVTLHQTVCYLVRAFQVFVKLSLSLSLPLCLVLYSGQ